MRNALFVYDNWSAYDELSDQVPLTEELALRQLRELVRLRKSGVQMAAYLMDAFWYEPAGGYRIWRKDRWPTGPERWLAECGANNVIPGLWFPANTAFHLEVPEAWRDSLAPDGWGLCCFQGGFLKGFMDALTFWYKRDVRIFKFDFADFGAAPAHTLRRMLPSEIRRKNIAAYRKALGEFKERCPDSILCAYNGFEEAEYMTSTDRPIRRVLDPKWLPPFDSIYCGDPRPSDLPLPNFWRTVDVYADHMIYYIHRTSLELPNIDNCGFMIGGTGTCYQRGAANWKSTLLLSLARSGSIHMALGNIENLTTSDAKWYAKAQKLFEGASRDVMVGSTPGNGGVYGYLSMGAHTSLTLVNPSLQTQSYPVGPGLTVVFRDGFVSLGPSAVVLGAGAIVVLCSDPKFQLGAEEGSVPIELEEIDCKWHAKVLAVEGELSVSSPGSLHAVFEQRDSKGMAVRTTGGSPPLGKSMAKLLRIQAWQGEKELAVRRPDDKVVWSGLSWAYGIVERFERGKPIRVRMSTTDSRVTTINSRVFRATKNKLSP